MVSSLVVVFAVVELLILPFLADYFLDQQFYRLADERREIILVACSKCDWRAAFPRDDLIASHGADYAMPNLLNHLAAPSCSRLGSNWDRCGVHYAQLVGKSRS